jgi:trk system potassium uptake protein TrkH
VSLKAAARILGRLLLLVALAEAVPVLCCLFYRELFDAAVFLGTSSVTLAAAGLLMAWGGRGDPGDLHRREGILIVAGGWVLASLFGALPYVWTGTLSHPVDAFFEAASGFTTTGASVLTDIESAGRGILFWRSFTQWLGGMGIIVLFVALLPEIVPGARFLFKLEVPGPTAETLHPRVRDTALVLWKIYFGFTLAETALLMVAGLDLYDALTHTFSTLSTGGFSPRNASVASFESPWVEGVIVLFMVLAGMNFSLFYGLRERRLGVRTLLRDPELRLYLAVMTGAVVVVVVDLVLRDGVRVLLRSIRESVFQVVSITTTTGFATADFDGWPALSRGLLLALMFMGGCAGSTAGSMKAMRVLIGLKYAFKEVRLVYSPNEVMTVQVGGRPVPDPAVRAVAGFFVLFIASWGVGTMLLAASGESLVTAASAAIATLGNVGPGLDAVGPVRNYAQYAPFFKVVMVLLMWLGRLEVYAIAALATTRYWRP